MGGEWCTIGIVDHLKGEAMKFNLEDLPDKFVGSHGEVYEKNVKIRDMLNSMFTANLRAAYTVRSSVKADKGGIDWSGTQIYLINQKGDVTLLTNSEWAFFNKLGTKEIAELEEVGNI